jgi:predicted nucleotidyltransferase component of viral defense system
MLHHSTIKPGMFELLKKIFNIPFIQENFALAGGTALALQTGHRASVDLDIFSPQVFSTDDVEILLAGNKEWEYKPVSRLKRMLFCHINDIKCDFVNEPFTLIEPFNNIEGVNLYSVPDIAAMKMHTICGRGKRKDFFDIYVLLEIFGWEKMLKWFEKKYGDSQFFFLWKSITYFSDADEDMDIRGFPPYTLKWPEIKQLIINKCR